MSITTSEKFKFNPEAINIIIGMHGSVGNNFIYLPTSKIKIGTVGLLNCMVIHKPISSFTDMFSSTIYTKGNIVPNINFKFEDNGNLEGMRIMGDKHDTIGTEFDDNLNTFKPYFKNTSDFKIFKHNVYNDDIKLSEILYIFRKNKNQKINIKISACTPFTKSKIKTCIFGNNDKQPILHVNIRNICNITLNNVKYKVQGTTAETSKFLKKKIKKKFDVTVRDYNLYILKYNDDNNGNQKLRKVIIKNINNLDNFFKNENYAVYVNNNYFSNNQHKSNKSLSISNDDDLYLFLSGENVCQQETLKRSSFENSPEFTDKNYALSVDFNEVVNDLTPLYKNLLKLKPLKNQVVIPLKGVDVCFLIKFSGIIDNRGNFTNKDLDKIDEYINKKFKEDYETIDTIKCLNDNKGKTEQELVKLCNTDNFLTVLAFGVIKNKVEQK